MLFGVVLSVVLMEVGLATFLNGNHPKQRIDATKTGLTFEGNQSVPDHFKLLERDGDFLLIGARDVVYNISMYNFEAHTDDCHNYIRILAKQSDDELLVCGSNSYKPTCRQYSIKSDNGTKFRVDKEFSGSGICPYDPQHNSTSFYLRERNELYAGTVADFAGTDPLVSKRQINEPDDIGLRTERSDSKCLNDPNFVSSFADADHVYLWFREGAVDHMNCGKAVHSRVSRVCKNDKGGPRTNADTWTTFLKARLNCSIPGDYPFYFDEISSTSAPVVRKKSSDGKHEELVYAIFNSPYSSIRASAVCAFSMDSIRKIFSESAYKAQSTSNANWLPILRSQVPQPRPGDCDSDSRLLSEEAVNFVKKNPLMDEVVPNYFQSPLFIQSGFNKDSPRFTQIAVDPQVPDVTGDNHYDVMFIGTDDGQFIKLINVGDGQQSKSIIIEVVKVFEDHAPIKNLLVYRRDFPNDVDHIQLNEYDEGRLIVVGEDMIKSLPLYNCTQATTCARCVHLQDPYCAWDRVSERCEGPSAGKWINRSDRFVQSVKDGSSKVCDDTQLVGEHEMKYANDQGSDSEDYLVPATADKGKNDKNMLTSVTRSTNRLSVDETGLSCKCPVRRKDAPQFDMDRFVDRQFAYRKAFDPTAEQNILAQARSMATPPMTITAQVFIGGIVVCFVVSLSIGIFLGILIPRLKQRWCKSRKFSKIPSNNQIFPQDSSKIISSFTPVVEKKLPHDNSVSINLSDSSPTPSSMYSSKTLPKEFRVKKTYL